MSKSLIKIKADIHKLRSYDIDLINELMPVAFFENFNKIDPNITKTRRKENRTIKLVKNILYGKHIHYEVT